MFVVAQREGAYSRHLVEKVSAPESPFLYDKFGILTGWAKLDRAIPKFVSLSLRKEVLKQEQDSTIFGHPEARGMCNTMRRFYSWPHMTNEIYNDMERRPSCQKHCQHPNRQRHLQLFLPKKPLEFVAIDVPEPAAKTKMAISSMSWWPKGIWNWGGRFRLRRRQQQTWHVPWWKIRPYHMESPPNCWRTTNHRLLKKVFNDVCEELGTKLLTKVAYNLQTNGQTDRNNITILDRLCHYISEHSDSWDAIVQPLAYTCKNQTRAMTKTTSFSLALTRDPPTASELPSPSNVSSQVKESLSSEKLRNSLFGRLELMQSRTVKAASLAENRYKENFDKHVKRVLIFAKNELVH